MSIFVVLYAVNFKKKSNNLQYKSVKYSPESNIK